MIIDPHTSTTATLVAPNQTLSHSSSCHSLSEASDHIPSNSSPIISTNKGQQMEVDVQDFPPLKTNGKNTNSSTNIANKPPSLNPKSPVITPKGKDRKKVIN